MIAQYALAVFFVACAVGIAWSSVSNAARGGAIVAWMGCIGAVALLVAGAAGVGGAAFSVSLWQVPAAASLVVGVDPISAVFLVVTGIVLLPASLYGASELRDGALRGRERPFSAMLLGLYASITLVVIAQDALLLLIAW